MTPEISWEPPVADRQGVKRLNADVPKTVGYYHDENGNLFQWVNDQLHSSMQEAATSSQGSFQPYDGDPASYVPTRLA